MTLNHYCRLIKYSFVLCCSILIGKSFSPQEIDLRENLQYNDNEREYFLLYKDELNYKIEGPVRLEIISRRAIPDKSKRKYEFGYTLSLEGSKPVDVIHSKYKKKNMISKTHPGHGYTQSGNTIVNLPKGSHNLKIVPLHKGKPILIRVIKEIYKRTEGITEIVTPLSDKNDVLENDLFVIKNNKRKYFQLKNDEIWSLDGIENEIFSIYGRTNDFVDDFRFSFYHIEVLVNQKHKHFIIDFLLDGNNVQKNKIYQLINNDQNKVSLKLIESNAPVFLRLIKNTPYE